MSIKGTPDWIYEDIKNEKLECHKCKKRFASRDLRSIGIRQGFDNKEESMYIELYCKKCDNTTLFELQEMDLVEFSLSVMQDVDILDEEMFSKGKTEDENFLEHPSKEMFEKLEKRMNRMNRDLKDKKNNKSKITSAEIKEAVKFLNSTDCHEDFLIAIGMSPEEIDSFKHIEDDKDKDKDKK